MAVLQKIRNKAGIFVIIFVGVALFLFIVDPTTFEQIFRKNDRDIAEINGDDIKYEEWGANYDVHRKFMEVAQQGKNLTAENEKSIRDQAWNDLLRTHVWNNYYEEVGIGVSNEELEDLLYGPAHVHSVIIQNFNLQKDEKTGEYDTKGPKDFFDNIYTKEDVDPSYLVIADYWKKVIAEDRLNKKYTNMVSKGFYTPSALAKMYYEEQNNKFDFIYAFRNYNTIKDEDVKVTDAEIEKYYKDHKNMFVEDNDNRDIEYVVFDVVPSKEDTAKIYKEMQNYHEEFSKLEDNYTLYAQNHSENQYREMFLGKTDIEKLGFSEEFFNSENGTVSDITLGNGVFIFGKILESASRPDSVNAAHILLVPQGDSITKEDCKRTADSLLNLVKSSKNDTALFAILATKYSQDPGSKDKGGDLGDFTDGTMVEEFNEACFTNKAGTYQIVETQYGVHLIKIKSQTAPVRKVKLAVLDQSIKFSDQTYDYAFQKSSTFSAKNKTAQAFDSTITAQNLVKKVSNKLTDLSDNIPGIENGREIVRWAFNEDRKVGDISDVFVHTDKFVVAKLTSIREKGIAKLEDVKERIEPEVIRELKAAKMIEEMKADASLSVEAIAQKYNAKFDTLTNISFSSFSLPGLGIEPKVNAVVSNISLNKVSAPIEGNNGVFVVNVFNANKAPEKTDFENEKLAKMRENANQTYRMDAAVKKLVNIKDMRAKFF